MFAQGGIAAAVGDEDSIQRHFDDTLAAGAGLCDHAAVRVLVEAGPAAVDKLIQWGVRLDLDDKGRLALGQEAAHSRRRVAHAGGDRTGLMIAQALERRLDSGVVALPNHRAERLIMARDRCIGADLRGSRGRTVRLLADAVILATGGAAALWASTTNPSTATGQGLAMAHAVGARLDRLEFIQFHPTALAVPGAPRFLVSEAVRGEGATVIDHRGARLLTSVDSRAELAPRDIVASAIWESMMQDETDHVFLDCRALGPRMTERFPAITEACHARGVDPLVDPIPIAPAAHYTIGGVVTNTDGATTVPGLYACGEVASTGVHGANRLASNSLLEGVVFGARAATAALRERGSVSDSPNVDSLPPLPLRSADAAAPADAAALMEALRQAMWRDCGLLRSADGLNRAASVATRVASSEDDTARSAGLIAGLVCAAAAGRSASCGCHQRSDSSPYDSSHALIGMRNERTAS